MPNFTTESEHTARKYASYRKVSVFGILTVYVAALLWGGYRHSPIADEPAYLASGISHWQFGHYELCKVSPPLVRLIAAFPLYVLGTEFDRDPMPFRSMSRLEHRAGVELLEKYGEDSFWLFTLGRWACIPFALLGALVCYRWGREWFGDGAGFCALLLWCVSPAVLAHAQMANADVGVTSLSVTTCYLFWHWARTLKLGNAVIGGVVLGLALLAKHNALILPPLLFFACFTSRFLNPTPQWKTTILHFAIAGFTALFVTNLGYEFKGSFTKLKDFHFVSSAFTGSPDGEGNYRFYGSFLDDVPVPLPAPFLEGIDLQKRDFENSIGVYHTYIRGNWYDHSWYWYYLYVLAVKVPVGTLVLFCVGTVIVVGSKSAHRSDAILFLLVPAVAFVLLASTQTGFGGGIRYILPCAPFAFLIASALFSNPIPKKWQVAGALTLLVSPIGSLYTFPHSLCYFNLLAGGPRNGHFHLIDSNLEWGQNLIYVKEWLERNQESGPVYVAQWSFYPIANLGFNYEKPQVPEDGPIPSGTYLISTNYLRGHPNMRQLSLKRFLKLVPDERIGYTTYVYRIP